MKITLERLFRQYFPVYINTINIFRPIKTWWKNRQTVKFPHIEFNIKKRTFDWVEENLYTWYWWDHITMWNFPNKWIIVLIDDVQYKYKFGLRELESVPFVLVRIFNWNFIIKLSAPNKSNDYIYYEQMKNI